MSSKFHICPRSFASKENVYFLENLSVAGIILRYIAVGRGLFTECLHLFSFRFVLYFLCCIRRGFPQYFLWFEMFRVSSGMVAQKNRKLGKTGNFAFKNRRKNRKIKSTFVDKDSLPAPHQGYNKGYASSASTFTGFRSTFTAQKEWKWSVTFSLLAQLRCNQNDMLDYRSSVIL